MVPARKLVRKPCQPLPLTFYQTLGSGISQKCLDGEDLIRSFLMRGKGPFDSKGLFKSTQPPGSRGAEANALFVDLGRTLSERPRSSCLVSSSVGRWSPKGDGELWKFPNRKSLPYVYSKGVRNMGAHGVAFIRRLVHIGEERFSPHEALELVWLSVF